MRRSPTDPLNILVYGAGAIGTYIGGSLARAGHRTLYLERPQAAAELRERGVILALPDGEYRDPKPAVREHLPEALAQGPFDAAVFALKSYDTRAAGEALQAYQKSETLNLGAFPPLLCLQNGVENESTLRELLGEDLVIAGTVTSAIGRQAVGNVRLERLRGIGVADQHKIAPRLVAAMSAAGLNARLYPRAPAMKWSKLLTNLIANASAAILDMSPAEIFAHPGLFSMEIDQLRETLAVMAAQQIPVVDLPGTPTRALGLAVKLLPAGVARPLLRRAIGRGRGGKMPSFHIDLHSGRRKSEVDYLNGAVDRIGARYNIPTPVNRRLTDILTKLTHQDFPLDEFQRKPKKLLNFVSSPYNYS